LNPSMSLVKSVAVALAIAAAVALGCTSKNNESGGGRLPPVVLAPVPEAPPMQVAPEALPGGDGSFAVVQALPVGPARGLIRPTITFSKPVVALGTVAVEKARAAPATLAPALPGEWKWLGSASVEFVPVGLWPYSTRFTVTVPAGLTAVDGSTMKAPYTYAFETPRPVVQEIEPEGGFRWLTPAQHFVLTLNQPVVDLAGHLSLLVAGEPWPVRLLKETSLADEKREKEAGRRYDRASFEDRGFKDKRTRYELEAGRPLPLDRAVTLIVSGDLRGTEGPLVVEPAPSWTFRTYGAMRVESMQACLREAYCPYGPLILETTNLADAKSLRPLLAIEPPVEIDWAHVEAHAPPAWDTTVHYPYVAIPGKFRPGTAYRVSVAKGLKDEFGQEAPVASARVTTSDLNPSFDLGSDVALLEGAGDGALPVESSNLSHLEVRIWSLTPAEVARLVGVRGRVLDESTTPPGEPIAHTLDLSGSRNVTRTRPLPVRQILGGKRSAIFFLKALAPEMSDQWRKERKVLGQITDLAVHTKLGATSGVVWVTRLSDGQPVEGAGVTVYDRGGNERWSGKTDKDGIATVPGLSESDREKEGREHPFALVAATKEGDTGVTLSNWTGGFAPWDFSVQADWDGKTPRSLGMVVAERGIYRPGDTVQLKGLLRYRKLGALQTPPAKTKVSVRAVSSRGKEVFAKELAVSEFGTFATSLVLEKDVPLGTYQLSAKATLDGTELTYGGSFRVEEYRAPQFKVDVAAPDRNLVAGDPVSARVLARYLFGGAMADAEVKWTVNRSTIAFQPAGNAGFVFGSQTWWWDDREPERVSEVFAGGGGRTDVIGALAISAGKAETPGDRTYEYTIEAEVTDVSRQRLANRAAIAVHPAAVYAGVRRRGTSFGEAGKPQVLELITASPDGVRKQGHVEVAVRRREWKWIRKKGVGDRWTTVVEPVEEPAGGCKVETGPVPGECSITPKQPGFYVVEATTVDGQGRHQTTRTGFDVTGSGWVSWQRDDSDRIDLVADKQLYDLGDTARILVKSPFPEAEALLTVEREGILSSRRVHLGGAATTLDVPLGEEAIPNVFVSVVVVRGRVPEKPATVNDDPGRPAVRVGYVQLKVEKKSKRLEVLVTPDAAEKRPRDKVKVNLMVRDWKGRGTPAEVAIWAVDEGVLRLTGYQVPDPVEAIHPLRGLSVRVGEPLIHLVMRKLYQEKGLGEGGSGGNDAAGAGLRSNFKTTVLFAPEVRTDASGRAHVEFELPDNLTSYRIMAIAVTRADLMGNGQAQVTVVKPLLALPALPRLARVGDSFEAGVVIHSPGAKVQEVSVGAEATGLAIEGAPSQKVSLREGKPREVRFRFRADVAGEAVLRFSVAGGGESDRIEQRIPVLLPVEQEAVAVYGDTKDVRREGLVPPAGVRKEVGGLELTLASTALGGFNETMRQLIEYPYGCLEQLSSRLVPFLALRELEGKFGVPHEGPKAKPTPRWMADWVGEDALRIEQTHDPDEIVRRTVKAIEVLQNHDGGYKYWPGSGCSAEWASSYAVLALGRAAELGYPVDAAALRRGQAYLADTVAAGRCTRCYGSCYPPGETTRVFALYALARTHAPKASYYGELAEKREKLPFFARAMLVDAMFVGGGQREVARQLLGELMNFAKVSPSEVHFEETDPRTYASLWSSDTRTTAIVLQTLADVSPDHPYVARLAAYLTRARQADGRFRNTQESAFTLMALTELVRVKEKDAPDFTAKVALGDRTVAEERFKGRSMDVRRVKLPMSDLALGGKQVPFDFRRDGAAGVLYYGALLRYAPSVMPVDALDRGIFVQRWFEPYEGGGQVQTVRAGDLVRVRVRIGTPKERNYVAIDVPLPAGLEVVDTTLASTASLSRAKGEEGRKPKYEYESGEDLSDGESGEGDSEAEGDDDGYAPDYARGFWSPFNHVERRDDRVVLFADRLPPGVHASSFIARATTPGDFVLKPAHAEEMYAPEVFGRSDGGKLKIAEAAILTER
jgi:alpha-2-macroglobulin